jgi:DNA polymerase-3 subunit delta
MIDSLFDKGQPPAIAVFFGEEDFLVEAAARALFERLAAADSSGMNADIVDGDSTSIDAVVSMARAYPMMTDHRVVWVRRFDSMTVKKDRKGRDPLSAYLADPPKHSTLIITGTFDAAHGMGAAMKRNAAATQKKIAAMRFPVGALLQHTSWIEFPRLRDNQVGPWLTKHCRELGNTITDEAIELLKVRIGSSLRELAIEIDKVRTYLQDGAPITEQAVSDVVGSEKSATIFELQKAIAKRNIVDAQRIIHAMLATSRQEMLIVNSLARFFVSSFMIADLHGSTDPATMAQRVGIPSFALNDYIDAVQAYGAVGLERAIVALADADSQLKSTGADGLTILQSMVASLAAPAR